ELLIVIGILAILTAAVVIVLNPAELLKQARDSQRMTDLDALENAIALFLADSKTFTANGSVVTTSCYVSNASITAGANGCNGAGAARHGTKTAVPSASTGVTGSGWLPLNLSAVSSGSPLSVLPLDPTNSTTYFYSFSGDTTALTFELNAMFESSKYTTKMTSDGGNLNSASTGFYEIGNDPGLDL
ncbi:MAG: type II secretion system protein, partial [Candidatus Paceibacterota bacterium]